MGRIAILALLTALTCGAAAGQQSQHPLTDSDVIRMVKAGISDHTILLEMKERPAKFDTSTRALIGLKNAGVSEEIIDAILRASQPAPADVAAKPLTGDEMIAKALDAVAPHDRLIAIHATRWTGSVAQSVAGDPPGNTRRFDEQRVRIFPGLAYLGMQRATGAWEKVVVTPEFSYRSTPEMTVAVPQAKADVYREEMNFEPLYIAQHLADYIFTPLGTAQEDGATVYVLRISGHGMEYEWRIDAATGQLLSAKHQVASGEVREDFADYKTVGGLTVPFKRLVTTPERTTELTLSSFGANPVVDETLFVQPASLSPGSLKLKVLETDSVSYTQDLGGDNSANCQVMQSAKTTGALDSLDDTSFSDEPGTNLKLVCNAWDQNWILPRILNAMLVVSSDGNAYAIACDKPWRWSKCAPLKAGAIFEGSRSENKINVEGTNADGKKEDVRYKILLTKTLQ